MAAQPEAAPPLSELRAAVADESAPIAKRIRSVFYLRALGTDEAIDAMAQALESPSVLLSHEVAFAMGQMKRPHAARHLSRVLQDRKYHSILRHEAAEALGAIGLPESIELLRAFAKDESPEVADTCTLALQRIEWMQQHGREPTDSPYRSVDPAPALERQRGVAEMRTVLVDPKQPLFERYRAMFGLRNVGSEAAVLALADALVGDHSSALFRHEVAYVMGQLQHRAAVPALLKALQDRAEHAMVRHEAAEALGAIGDEELTALLKRFQVDEERIVRESCDVALDIMDYWRPAPAAAGH